MIRDNRLGRFQVACEFIGLSVEMADLWSRCVPVRAESLWHSDVIEYIAISAEFDPVPRGAKIPEYDVIVEGGRVRFQRMRQA